jgi:hypothetical protein
MAGAAALTDEDILNHPVVLRDPVNLVQYPDLKHMRSLDEVFRGKKAAIILYNVVAKGNGHWILLVKHKPDCELCTRFGSNRDQNGHKCPHGVIEYFDPYGNPADMMISVQCPSRRRALDQEHCYLSKLMAKSDYCIIFNDQIVQSKRRTIETCGHHVLARLRLRHLQVDDYVATLRAQGPNMDRTVVRMYNEEI